MEKAGVNRWHSGPGSSRSSAGDVAHGPGTGVGRGSAVPSAAKSSSNPGLPGNAPAMRPAQEKASFGGPKTSKSLLVPSSGVEFQFGSYSPGNLDPPPASSVQSVAVGKKEIKHLDRVDERTGQTPEKLGAEEVDSAPLKNVQKEKSAFPPVSDVQSVAVGNKEIKEVDRVYEQTGQSTHKSGAEEVNSAPPKKMWGVKPARAPRKGSPSPNWPAKDAERNKTSDPSTSFSLADFPELGGASSGPIEKKGQTWRPEAAEQNVSVPKPGVDLSARVEVSSKWDARRETATSRAERRGHERDEQSKFERGRAGGGNHWRDGGGEWRDPIDSLGRTLTRILRHQAVDLKIKLRSDGYVDVQELLKLHMKTGSGRPLSSHTVEDVLKAVELDNKQRFGIKEENTVLLIRANQGHTIKAVETEHLLKPVLTAEEIPVCVHGTYRKFLTSIFKEGLKRMSRNHVHFASGLSPTEGVISGMRKTSEILIYLNVSKALEDGMKLYISENGVILTEGFNGVVPPNYFKEVRSWPDNKPVTIK